MAIATVCETLLLGTGRENRQHLYQFLVILNWIKQDSRGKNKSQWRKLSHTLFPIGKCVPPTVTLCYVLLQEVHSNGNKMIFLDSVTLIPTSIILLQFFMSGYYFFPKLFVKLFILHIPFVFVFLHISLI